MKKIILHDFKAFLKEYKIISLAIAFVMGQASTALVNSLVKDLFMPLVAPLLSSSEWKTAAIVWGPVRLNYGSFLAELINFTILAFVVFMIARVLFQDEQK